MKELAKNLMFYGILVLYLPLHLCYHLLGLCCGLDRMFMDYSQALSILPGYLGCKVRGVFYHLTLAECPRDLFVEMGTFFVSRDCRLGRNVYIGSRCIVSYAQIGDDVLIGSNVNILSGKQQHIISDVTTPIRLQGGVRTLITIGEDCWLGNCSVIMANVGSKSVIASGAVVIKDVDAYSIMGGNPAKLIKKRV
jgi:virginiamycin A acetyltransferase